MVVNLKALDIFSRLWWFGGIGTDPSLMQCQGMNFG